MFKKIDKVIKEKALQLFQQGYRSESIAKRVGVGRTTVKQWQARFDSGDLSWVTDTSYTKVAPEKAWLAVTMYTDYKSYSAVARALGLASSRVRQYVLNVNQYGCPILPQGRPCRKNVMKQLPKKRKSPRPPSLPKEVKAAHKIIEEQRIVLESLLEAIDEQLGGASGSKKKISFLTQQLKNHIVEGYLLPDLANLQIPPGAPITDILERLVNACWQIKSSGTASQLCKKNMKDVTAFDE